MASNHTEHYQLCQWLGTDQVKRTDFNEDNVKIDAALAGLESGKADTSALSTLSSTVAQKADASALNALSATVGGLSSTVAGHTTQLTQKGNCRIWSTTYTGNDQYGASAPRSITFPSVPFFVIIVSDFGSILPLVPATQRTFYQYMDNLSSIVQVTWSGSTASWYSTNNSSAQMNLGGTQYRVIAWMPAD